MKEIYTNNGCKLEITSNSHGVIVFHMDSNNNVYDIDNYSDDEIVMALNLLHYMKDNGKQCAYVCGLNDESYFHEVYSTPIRSGDLEEFLIFAR